MKQTREKQLDNMQEKNVANTINICATTLTYNIIGGN